MICSFKTGKNLFRGFDLQGALIQLVAAGAADLREERLFTRPLGKFVGGSQELIQAQQNMKIMSSTEHRFMAFPWFETDKLRCSFIALVADRIDNHRHKKRSMRQALSPL